MYTSERYPESAAGTSAFAKGAHGESAVRRYAADELFAGSKEITVWPDKVSPKKFPFLRLYRMTGESEGAVIDTVVIPSDLPEGKSVTVGFAKENEATKRWVAAPTKGAANATEGLVAIGPNVGPLYELKSGKKTVNLYGMIQRGTAVLPETRKKLDDRLLAIRNRLKTPEQLMRAARAGGRLYIDPKVRERYERLQKEALARDEISPRAREFIAAVSVAPRDAQSAEKARMEIHKAVKDGLVRIDRIGDQLLNIDIALKDWVRAEIDALDILRFNRRHLRANAVMGAINGVRGDREAAERYLRRALEAGENDAIACNDLAFLLVSQGRAKEAIPLARLAARLRPLDWNFRETLAIALIRGGVPDEGEMELKMAEEIAAQAGVPNGKVVRFDLDRAWLYKVRGQEIPLQVTLTNLHRAVGLSKAHLKEVEVLEK